jgi:GNAT superfamily N-acetyltransferase
MALPEKVSVVVETQVRTPQMVFMQPQRLIVPLFQRPYVWNKENQWEPLWNDLVRVTERHLRSPHQKHYPHFLGAVVLQQVQNPMGSMQERTIIDGQQRLTTLQILLDALHAELLSVNATAPALRIEPLVLNAEPFCSRPEDRFKVWPTNRDRPAFNSVMGSKHPVNHDAVGHVDEKMVEAHRFFSEQAREWLSRDGTEQGGARAAAIEAVARDRLQMVVIDLTADENAQEIFETLNARGVQLTPADLIKNFVFQRLLDSGADVEDAYERYWKEFEVAFWETQISAGRLRLPRSSIFLNHWLVTRTGEEVLAREVFQEFKNHANREPGPPMLALLAVVNRAAHVYRSFVQSAADPGGSINRLGLFGYRTGVLESEVIKPLVLCLLDPEEPPIPIDQLTKALDVVESWMVRRMLIRATTKNYNQVVADLIAHLRKGDRTSAGDAVEAFLASQTSDSRYWPDNKEVREELQVLPAYRRLGRGRLRMVLEAIEDHKRGWHAGQEGLGGERVARGKFTIEHIMPRKWTTQHWPLPEGSRGESERDGLIHTIGNLTLLTSRLNSKVSNGPWIGETGKRQGLEAHDVLKLNLQLLKEAGDAWTDAAIRARSEELSRLIVEIWPVPEGHRSGFSHEKARPRHKVDLSDLLSAGWLKSDTSLFARRKKFAEYVATLLPDGRLDIRGIVYSDPSEAAKAITGKSTNGWWFILVDQKPRRALRDVRREYLESFAVDIEEEDDAGDDGDDDL